MSARTLFAAVAIVAGFIGSNAEAVSLQSMSNGEYVTGEWQVNRSNEALAADGQTVYSLSKGGSIVTLVDQKTGLKYTIDLNRNEEQQLRHLT